jgi:hypothetical protein
MPGMWPDVLGPRQEFGWVAQAQVFSLESPASKRSWLRVWQFSGPCGGLYVPVRAIGDAGA